MKNRTLWSVALVLAVAGVVLLVGCKKKQATPPEPVASVGVVNSQCPIMPANAVDKDVSGGLVRTFKGQKVGFCCGECPLKWDKLTDEQRTQKLANVK